MVSKIGIVLLNWNGWKDTCTCLDSLRRLHTVDFEVVVVDNASTDGSASKIRKQYPEATLFEASRNLGFAGGCNIGIRHLLDRHFDFVWLLNNDTSVESGALSALIHKATCNPKMGAIGSVIYSADHKKRLEAWGGGYIDLWLGRSRHFLRPVPDESLQFITGASMLIRKEAIEDVGMLDERFFMYWEDADFCFRLHKAGWKLGAAGESRIWHKGSASVGKESARLDRYFNASARRFFQKHAPIPSLTIWIGSALRMGKRAVKGDWTRARAVLDAVTDQETSRNQPDGHRMTPLKSQQDA